MVKIGNNFYRRLLVSVLFVLTIILNYSYSQTPQPSKKDRDIDADLKFALPEADNFKKNEKPRYYIGYKNKKIIGYAFYTFDLAKDIKGFNGPINLLVGTDKKKRIKNIKLLEHREYRIFVDILLDQYKLLENLKKNITHRDIIVKGEVGVGEGVEIIIGEKIFAKTEATPTASGISRSIKKSLQIIDNCYVPGKIKEPVPQISKKDKKIDTAALASYAPKKDKDIESDLKSVLPEADNFKKNKKPLYYIGYKNKKIIGYAFYTFDLAPDIKGFNGSINLLVGTDKKKRIQNVKLLEHIEDKVFIDDMLLSEHKFLESFKKDITHKDISIKGEIEDEKGVEIKIGKDIFAKTGATLSALGITRGIKKGLQILNNSYVSGQDKRFVKKDREKNVNIYFILAFFIVFAGIFYKFF
jgi:transcriptional regulator of nitric oxide reductase